MSSLAHAVALSGLPGMGPRELAALVGDPEGSWDRVRRRDATLIGDPPDAAPKHRRTTVARWFEQAQRTDPARELARHLDAGIGIHVHGRPGYPAALEGDHQAPAVLYSRGDLALLDGRRAAVVGTRRCTATGASIARELGRELAAAGVAVVSGLALGIDGAAHGGALAVRRVDPAATGPVGVVGSGLDVVYPRRHRALWEAVATQGLLLSEAPLGTAPEGWRFPARNRLIAALGEVLVVVESHDSGGSLSSAAHAEARGRPVLAVPGSPRNPAAAGTNRLIADGCHPVVDAGDVVVALGLVPSPVPAPPLVREPQDPDVRTVLEALGTDPASLELLVTSTGLPLARVAKALALLQEAGDVTCNGTWYEPAGDR